MIANPTCEVKYRIIVHGVSFEEFVCGLRKGHRFVLMGEGEWKCEDGSPIQAVGDDEDVKIDARCCL